MIFDIFLCLLLIFNFAEKFSEGRAVAIKPQFHSDVIETHWPDIKIEQIDKNEQNDEGFMKKQLRRFGEMASKIGNSVGAGATTITNAIDKVCEVVKTVIPLLTAVCHVGQYKFCSATLDAPEQLNRAIRSGYQEINLDIPD